MKVPDWQTSPLGLCSASQAAQTTWSWEVFGCHRRHSGWSCHVVKTYEHVSDIFRLSVSRIVICTLAWALSTPSIKQSNIATDISRREMYTYCTLYIFVLHIYFEVATISWIGQHLSLSRAVVDFITWAAHTERNNKRDHLVRGWLW